MNIFKKFKLYFEYKKILKVNKQNLLSKFNIKIDNAYRCYTLLNFPAEIQENVKKLGYKYLDEEVKKFLRELDTYFITIGLNEFLGLEKADQVTPYNVLIVLRFKFLNTVKLKFYTYLSYLLLIIGLIISLFIIF